ncbi:MAG: phage virion morphogenesis protein [Methylobacter sp.]|nr:phage virion morphogenesis protein [Methylobacter sp.]
MIRLSANRVNLDNLKRQAQVAINRLPPLLGAEAVRHTKENFRQGAFVDATAQPWEKRKNDPDPGRGVLIGKGTGHLFRDMRILNRTNNMVTVGTTLPYAKIHNDGGVIAHPGGTAFFIKKGKIAYVSNRVAANLATAGHKLPRTKAHAIRIPQRKFLGQSVSLNKKLHTIVARELKNLNNK